MATSLQKGYVKNIREYLSQPIDTRSHLFEAQLFVLSVAIGIQDAVSFPAYHCFASNQTGNTVLFSVGIFQLSSSLLPGGESTNLFSISTIAVSLGFFVLGVLMSGQIAHWSDVTSKRWWLIASNITQTSIVFIATALLFTYPQARLDGTLHGRLTLGLLAFSSGMQVAMVRALKVSDITTAMATAAYVDIFIDPKLCASFGKNRARNRRVVFLLSLIIGSFLGAGISWRIGDKWAILVSAIFKATITMSLCLNGSDPGLDCRADA